MIGIHETKLDHWLKNFITDHEAIYIYIYLLGKESLGECEHNLPLFFPERWNNCHFQTTRIGQKEKRKWNSLMKYKKYYTFYLLLFNKFKKNLYNLYDYKEKREKVKVNENWKFLYHIFFLNSLSLSIIFHF